MIVYILTSILLSGAGWGAYWWLVRPYASLGQQRAALWFAVAGSLIWPFFSVNKPSPLPASPRWHAVAPAASLSLHQYCRCEQPDYSHRIRYRANVIYTWLFGHAHHIVMGAAGMAGLVGLFVGGQLLYLVHLSRTIRRRPITVQGQSCTLLYPERELGVGAFWWGGAFIIWSDHADTWSEEEQQAVLLHELSHIRQGSTPEKAILRILQCIWFMNPCWYLIRRELDLISEYRADEAGAAAMSGNKAYAAFLIRLQQHKFPALASALTGSVLRLRIYRLTRTWQRHPSRVDPARLIALILMQIIVVSPVQARVQATAERLHTYAMIQQHLQPGDDEGWYCQDCDTVCSPE